MPGRRNRAEGHLAVCGLAAGCAVAGLGFVPAGLRPARATEHHSVVASPTGASERAPPASSLAPCLATAAVGAALAVAGNGRRRATALQRAAAAETPAPAAKGPPPPPPFDPAKQPGVSLPLMYWDPAGFCKVGDKEGFRNYRVAELKHGRVAMLAALGAVMQHFIKFPGFDQVPCGIEAVITPPGTYGLVVLVLACGVIETQVWTQDPEKEPGDFGDPAGVGQYYEEWRTRELNNGRMAMISILGILGAELATGKDGVDQIWGTTVGNLPVE